MRAARLLGAAAAALLTAGCAVHSNPGKPLQVRLDHAEIFGQDVAEIQLPGGGTAKLRQLQGRFSLKLPDYSRVVEFDKATGVRLVAAQQVADRTLIVVEKSERNCKVKTQLLAIKEREVRMWDFGNCQSSPGMEIGASDAVFDVPHRRGTTRYIYNDGQLLYGELRAGARALPAQSARPQAPANAPATVPGDAPATSPGRPAIAFPLPAPSAPEPASPATARPAATAGAAARPPGGAGKPAARERLELPTPLKDMPLPPKRQEPQTIHMIDR